MTLEQMKSDLSIEKIPACFSSYYAQIKDSWKARAAQILSDEYITETFRACYAMLPYQEAVLRSARVVRQNPAMCLLICLLEKWIRDGNDPEDPSYTPPAAKGPGLDFLHLFPVIPTMPESVAFLRQRNAPEDVIADSLQEYDASTAGAVRNTGTPSFSCGRLSWLCNVVWNRFVHIDRFKYDLPDTFIEGARVYENDSGETVVMAHNVQVHRSGRFLGSVGHEDPEGSFYAQVQETETEFIGHRAVEGIVETALTALPKAQWHLCLCETDKVIRIHIPKEGSFDKKTIMDSYVRARKVFAECFPDHPYKAFFCSSWLMSSDLHGILKPTSNILGFQEPFTRLPFKSTGTLVFSFAFDNVGAVIPTDIDALPENTSLQRAVKQLHREGGYIHEGAGFFF